MSRNKSGFKPETITITQGRGHNAQEVGGVNPPIHLASTVIFPSLEALRHSNEHIFNTYHYARLGTPTTFALEETIAELEGGYKALSSCSGLSAITTSIMAFAKHNTHILVSVSAFEGTKRFCNTVLKEMNVETTYFSTVEEARNHLKENTALVFAEVPGSRELEMMDIQDLSSLTKEKSIPLIVDNTWATPVFFKPLEWGADISIQAATKYISGHSDVIMGLITCKEKFWEPVRMTAFYLGNCSNSHDAYMTLRGLRTLPIRMEKHQENTIELVKWLKNRKEVIKIFYPALESHAGHKIWKKQFSGASGRFLINIKPVPYSLLEKALDNMKIFGMGYSWGGYESLLTPEYTTQEEFEKSGKESIPLRLNIGLENIEDLKQDLEDFFNLIS